MRPISGLAGVGAHPRYLSQHQGRLLGRADSLGGRQHVEGLALEQRDRLAEPRVAAGEERFRGVGRGSNPAAADETPAIMLQKGRAVA